MEYGPSFNREEWYRKVCGNHQKQFDFATDPSTSKLACSGRQSGKTWIIIAIMVAYALENPGATCLYLSFSQAATERSTWRLAKEFFRTYGLNAEWRDRKGMIEFANGSALYMLGSDDIAHVETFRGGKSACIVVDEAGAQPASLLQPMIDEVLEPMLRASNGPLIVIGTPPRRKAGWFWEAWSNSANGWKKTKWTGEDNPHCVEPFATYIERVAKRRGVDWRTDPKIRREYFAEWVDDTSACVLPGYSDANNYEPAKTVWKPQDVAGDKPARSGWHTPLEADEQCAIGVDPGSRDRLAIVVAAWRPRDGRVRQVAEWIAPRDSHSPVSVVVEVCLYFQRIYDDAPIYMDSQGRMAIDTMVKDWNIPLVAAANKKERTAQLDRLNDLATRGLLLTAYKSDLDVDCRLTEWDERDADPAAVRKYTNAHHPDALDAFRYALSNYWLEHAQSDDSPKGKERRRVQAYQDEEDGTVTCET